MSKPAGVEAIENAIRQVQEDIRRLTRQVADLQQKINTANADIQTLNSTSIALTAAKNELYKRARKCPACGGSGYAQDSPGYGIGSVKPMYFMPQACHHCNGSGYEG